VITFIIVSYNDIILASRFHPFFPTFQTYLVPSLVGALVALQIIGFLHGRWQQETDVMKSNKALLEALRQIVREELAARSWTVPEHHDRLASARPQDAG